MNSIKIQRWFILFFLFAFTDCKKVDYEWENYEIAAAPKVTLNKEVSALPTFESAKVSFFNLKQPDFATNQYFEWILDYYDFDGRAPVTSIEVYISFNKRESPLPAYPLVLSLAGVHPTERQFPLPSVVRNTDQLYETVSEFPKTYRFSPQELADITHTDLTSIQANDYFLFKFIVNMANGKRIVQYSDNNCDESRGEPCDCRIGVRFKNQ